MQTPRDLSTLTNTELRDAYHAARACQANASRMNRSAGVFAMELELEACYAEADARGICLTRPELDPDPEPASPASAYARALAIDAADRRMRAAGTERDSDLIDDGYGLRARGGLGYFG